MIKKILAVLAAIGGFFSAVFYVLFKQAKVEQQRAEKEKEAAEKQCEADEVMLEAEKKVAQAIKEQEAENEQLIEKAHSGNNLNAFNSGIELLRQQAEKGRKRNNSAGSSGT